MNPMFYIVDVFAQDRFTGNQLAVVKSTENLSDTDMLRIAKELYFSETAFIVSDQCASGGFDVRIFTPSSEVPYSGHATLGTASVINQMCFENDPQKTIQLNIKAGEMVVDIEEDILWQKQIPPEYGHIYEPVLLSKILGIEPEDIDKNYPIQEVSTGLPFIIVPLKNLSTMKEIEFNKERYYWLVKKPIVKAKIILAFCPETYNSDDQLNVRVFADFYGIPEDAASGSGIGALMAYLVQNNYFGSEEINIRVEQGYEIARPSLLFAKATKNGNQLEISVGGRVITVAKGELL
jgi:trans-2,3-dihydro-3-hydroxyanthranilate isomerase